MFDGGAADHSPFVPKELEDVPAAEILTLGEEPAIKLSGEEIEQLAGGHAYFVPCHNSTSVIRLRCGLMPMVATNDTEVFCRKNSWTTWSME